MKEDKEDVMSKLIREYRETNWDETLLIRLMEIRRELSVLVYKLSVEVRNTAIAFNKCYADRKVQEAKFKIQHITHGDSGTLAEPKSVVDAKIYREAEALAEGKYRGGKAVLDAAGGVLSSMEQDISFYKKLYDRPNE